MAQVKSLSDRQCKWMGF